MSTNNTILTKDALKKSLKEFFELSNQNFEIYNEFSLQHELGIFLRNAYPSYKIEFERNISHFQSDGVAYPTTAKKEIDISIYSNQQQEKYAIELKYPRNGQYPEQMFKFIKDIKFMEELVDSYGFDTGFAVVLVDHNNFHTRTDQETEDSIYNYFRNGKKLEADSIITKPTGAKDTTVTLRSTYDIKWDITKLVTNGKFYIVEVTKSGE